MDRQMKCFMLAACAGSFWLSALSPVDNRVKGVFYGLALGAGVRLVGESKKLIIDEARATALAAMNEELEQTEIALHSYQQEQRLTQHYTTTYPPEVETELKTSLEHLYSEPSAEHPAETSTSTSENKSLYLAVKRLLEVESETYVIEQILKMGGRRFANGKQRLAEILEEGDRNEW